MRGCLRFITFDLDAAQDSRIAIARLGLEEGKDFILVGVNKPGRQAIEGLLPDRILSAVHGRETDLVMALGSQKGDERKVAKSALKARLLSEFKNNGPYQESELKNLSSIGKVISKKFL